MTLTLVTGGTGYLGRHLVHQLVSAGRAVRVLARAGSDVSGLDGVETVRGDVTSRADLERAMAGAGRVFHLAAETRDGQPTEAYRKVNVDAVETLLELAPKLGVRRVVHASSYFAIGRTGPPRNAEGFVADEYWTHDPSDMHDAHEESKYDAESAVNQRVSISEPVLALMPTMMYGPEHRPAGSIRGPDGLAKGNRIVRMLAEHARGRYPGLPGDGRQLWNLVHVEDVARGFVAAMDAEDPVAWPPPRWHHWHLLLGGENVAVADLWARFGQLAGVAPPKPAGGGLFRKLFGGGDPRSKERLAMDSHSWAYTSAMAEGDLGYHGRGLGEGLPGTVDWMRAEGLLGSGAR